MNRDHKSRSTHHQWQNEYILAAWMAGFLGLALTLVSFWSVNNQLLSHKDLEFKWVSENRHRALSKEITDTLDVIYTTHNLFLISNDLTEQELISATSGLLEKHQAIEVLAWMPRSDLDTSSAGMEQELSKRFPVKYMLSSRDNKGYYQPDYMSVVIQESLLLDAMDTGRMVASGRVEVIPISKSNYGFTVFMPVYKRAILTNAQERRHNIVGFVMGLIRIDSLAKVATTILEPRGVEFLILDNTSPVNSRFLDFYSSRLSQPTLLSPDSWQTWIKTTATQLTDTIELAGRTWSVIYAPTAEYRSAAGFQHGAWIVLISGLLLTLLLTKYLLRINKDVNMRTEMGNALSESEEKFRQIAESIEEVFWLQNLDSSEVLYVSPAYEKIWGCSRDSLYKNPLSFLDNIHPDDISEVKQGMQRLPNEDIEQVFRIVRPDGTLRWVRSRMFKIYNEQGEAYRVAGIREDITEIKKVEHALTKSEKELRSLIEQSPDIITTVSGKGVILSVNRPLGDIKKEYTIGQDYAEHLPSEYRSRYEKKLKKVFTKGRVSSFRYLNTDSEWWDVRLVPIRRNDEVIESMIIETDVTEVKNMQEQANRNARLASIGVLAASVAHEINNPNNAIQFNIPVLSRVFQDTIPIIREYRAQNGDFVLGGLNADQVTEVIPQLLSSIHNSTRRIQKIVSNLKNMSRLDKGDLSNDVDLVEVLQASISIIKGQIHKYTDNFSVEFAPTLPPIKGNEQQLEQVFINVILNALQALTDSTQRVSISVISNQKKENIMIVISDDGRGIPEDQIHNVTKPFYTTKEESGGTGLGLSISNSIIKEHGGKMEFSSTPSTGTDVTIILPVSTPQK